MQEEKIRIRQGDEFIRLGQALKLVGAVSSGFEAKLVITEGEVSVNGEQELRRGRKLRDGDVVEFGDYRISVSGAE